MFFDKIKNKMAMKNMTIPPIEDRALSDYLVDFTCTRCHNHCKLSNIKCGGGLAGREQKTAEYNNSLL